jgi:histidinol phosphatase-like PHP family hydrolase
MERDLHIHTFFSPCAEPTMSFPAILAAAEKAGVQGIGLTDHPHRPGLARHHRALDAARGGYPGPVRVWIGAELEVTAMGQLVVPPSELPLADYIIAAASHYDIVGHPPVPNLEDPVAWADRLLTDLENVSGSGANAVAHPFYAYALLRAVPGYPTARLDDILEEIRPKRVDRLLEMFAKESIALEISPRLCLHLGLESFIESTYRKARQMGVKFTTGSDSHRVSSVGQLGQAEYLVQRLDFGPGDFWSPEMAVRRT